MVPKHVAAHELLGASVGLRRVEVGEEVAGGGAAGWFRSPAPRAVSQKGGAGRVSIHLDASRGTAGMAFYLRHPQGTQPGHAAMPVRQRTKGQGSAGLGTAVERGICLASTQWSVPVN